MSETVNILKVQESTDTMPARLVLGQKVLRQAGLRPGDYVRVAAGNMAILITALPVPRDATVGLRLEVERLARGVLMRRPTHTPGGVHGQLLAWLREYIGQWVASADIEAFLRARRRWSTAGQSISWFRDCGFKIESEREPGTERWRFRLLDPVPGPVKRVTYTLPKEGCRRRALLDLLLAANGDWVPLPECRRVSGLVSVSRGIWDLKEAGCDIANRRQRVGRECHSWYRLLNGQEIGGRL